MKRKGSSLFLAMMPCKCGSDLRIAAEPARVEKRMTRPTTTRLSGRLPTIHEEPISKVKHQAMDVETLRRGLSMHDHISVAVKEKMVENGKKKKTASVITEKESQATGMEVSYVHLMLEVAGKVSSGGFGRW